ncbi:hypothetical protein [Vibrio owensii]|uniref:hypothetical protein n=1 Tax=Vibrio owensii TaxID=696485 RepID=UPI003CC6BDDB
MTNHYSLAAKELESLISNKNQAPISLTVSSLMALKSRIKILKDLGSEFVAPVGPAESVISQATLTPSVKSEIEILHSEYKEAFPDLFDNLPNYCSIDLLALETPFSDAVISFLKSHNVMFMPDSNRLEDDDLRKAILHEYQAVEAKLFMHVKRHGFQIPRSAVLEGCLASLRENDIAIKDAETFLHSAQLDSRKHACCHVLLERKVASKDPRVPRFKIDWSYDDFRDNTYEVKRVHHSKRDELEFDYPLHIIRRKDAGGLNVLGSKYEIHHSESGAKKCVCYIDKNTPSPRSIKAPSIIIEDDILDYVDYPLHGMKANRIELRMNHLKCIPSFDCQVTLTLRDHVDLSCINEIHDLENLHKLDLEAALVSEVPLNMKLPNHVLMSIPLNAHNMDSMPRNVLSITAPDGEEIPCLMINNIPSCIQKGHVIPISRVLQQLRKQTYNHPVLGELKAIRKQLIELVNEARSDS